MPVIMFYGPQLSTEQKQNLVKNFAKSASDITNVPANKFVTLINEYPSEDVGTGTELLANTINK